MDRVIRNLNWNHEIFWGCGSSGPSCNKNQLSNFFRWYHWKQWAHHDYGLSLLIPHTWVEETQWVIWLVVSRFRASTGTLWITRHSDYIRHIARTDRLRHRFDFRIWSILFSRRGWRILKARWRFRFSGWSRFEMNFFGFFAASLFYVNFTRNMFKCNCSSFSVNHQNALFGNTIRLKILSLSWMNQWLISMTHWQWVNPLIYLLRVAGTFTVIEIVIQGDEWVFTCNTS